MDAETFSLINLSTTVVQHKIGHLVPIHLSKTISLRPPNPGVATVKMVGSVVGQTSVSTTVSQVQAWPYISRQRDLLRTLGRQIGSWSVACPPGSGFEQAPAVTVCGIRDMGPTRNAARA